MKHALFFLFVALSLPRPGFGQGPAQDKEPAACTQWVKIKIPAADLPSPNDRKDLSGTFSEDLYFGFGQPADPVQARKSAYLERESGDAPVFGGSAMLMMIYANGKGAARNFDLALKFACEISDPMIASSDRIDHLLALREQDWAGNDFSLCDDAGGSFLVGACTGLDEQLRELERARKLDGLTQRWTAAEKNALCELQKANADFTQASARNEVDTTGTGRASFIFEWETWLRDGLLEALQRSEKGQLPNFSAADFKSADDALNTSYSAMQSAGEGAEGMGDVTPDGVKIAERAWLKLREAWVKFGAIKYSSVSPESWRTWLTYDRIVMLHFVPGPGTPEWAAFHEYVPWRYQYELGDYREAMRLKPDWALPHYARAEDLDLKGDWEGAVEEYREAVRLDPNYFDAHEHLASTFKGKEDWNNAAKEYREVVRLKPNDATWHFALAEALEANYDLDGAIPEYREAARLTPIASYISSLGDALRHNGDFAGAIQAYQQVIRLEPGEAGYRRVLGRAFEGKNDPDNAIKEYREATRLNPKDSEAHDLLGSALHDKHDLDGAAQEYRAAILSDPKDAYAHDGLGIILDEKADRDAAILEYREALRLDPKYVNAHHNLAAAFEHKGDNDAALAEYREVVRLGPDDAEAHWEVCRFLAEVKHDFDAGIAECRESIRLKPDNVHPHGELGWMLERKKDFDSAIAEDHEAIRLRPGWSLLVDNLGWALYEKGEVDAAIVQYREALRLKPDDAQAHLNLGVALDQKGDWDAAIREYREAWRIAPDNPGGLHYYVGLALEHKGDKPAAIEEYRQAAEADPKNADYRAAYDKLRQKLP